MNRFAVIPQGFLCKSFRVASHEDLDISKMVAIVGDPDSKLGDYICAYSAIKLLEIKIDPDFWIDIVNDERFSTDRRREALVTFFELNAQDFLISELGSMPSLGDWFQENNQVSQQAFRSPIRTNEGESLFSYQPALLRFDHADSNRYSGNGAIIFSLSEEISEEELLDILHGQSDDDKPTSIRSVFISLHSRYSGPPAFEPSRVTGLQPSGSDD